VIALRPPGEAERPEIFPLGKQGVSAPRALAAGDGNVWTFDDRGHLLRYDYDGKLLDDVRLIKTLRGFPNGAFLEPGGTVLIADSHESRLLRVEPDGEKIGSFGGYGSEPGQFVYPQRLVEIGDRVYVTEFGFRENCRVQVFSVDGEFLFTFGEWGKEGPRFARPAGIAASPDGRLFVADATHRILVWSGEGEPLYQFGEEGKEPGRLSYPWGVAADDEYLYVSEYGNHRLSRFRFDGSFAGCFGGPEVFRFPRDVAIADGWLFVADTGQDRVVRLALSDIPWRPAP
jgi:sugar lactone lactonase YvrE